MNGHPPGAGLRLLPVLAMLAMLAGCAPGIGGDDDGIGGTGASPGPDGIGGTGTRATRDPDGIGGTGVGLAGDPEGIGGTGVVGEITALGSIQVNGLWIRMPPTLRVWLNGAPAVPADLVPGQIIAVHARSRGGDLVAVQARVRDALVGPVDGVDPAAGVISMMGHRLRVPRRFAGGGASVLSTLRRGQRLRVSGLWRKAGDLHVTAIAPARAAQPDSVYGPVSAVTRDGLRMGGLSVSGVTPAELTPGRYVWVSGEVSGSRLRAAVMEPQPLIPFQGRVDRLVVEGYGAPGAGIGSLSASAADMSVVRESLQRAAREGQRIRVRAVVGDGVARILELRAVEPRSGLLPPLHSGRLAPAVGVPLPAPSVPGIQSSQPVVRALREQPARSAGQGPVLVRPQALDGQVLPGGEVRPAPTVTPPPTTAEPPSVVTPIRVQRAPGTAAPVLRR